MTSGTLSSLPHRDTKELRREDVATVAELLITISIPNGIRIAATALAP